MKIPLLAFLTLGVHISLAAEYKLQFAANGAQNLVVAGYDFGTDTVIGTCSYDIWQSGGGRGSHSVLVHHPNTCTWDLFGNLLSLTPGSSPTAPKVISRKGTEVVYAVYGNGSTTGLDTRGFGFVSTTAPRYSWETPSGYAVIPYAPYTLTATLISDGDLAVELDKAVVTTAVSGLYTPSPGTAEVASTTCRGSLAIGKTCSVTVTYNPKTIACTDSPTGYAYTTLTLTLVTNSPAASDFTEGFTITGLPICGDN